MMAYNTRLGLIHTRNLQVRKEGAGARWFCIGLPLAQVLVSTLILRGLKSCGRFSSSLSGAAI